MPATVPLPKIRYLRQCFIFLTSIFISACNKIETGNTLSKKDKNYIKSIVRLDKDEVICKFYSEYQLKEMGNFYTNKRIVEYSIHNNDHATLRVFSALYQNITAIDTVYDAGLTSCPYLSITQIQDDTMQTFRVCFEGDKNQLKDVFEDAIRLWKNTKAQQGLPTN